MTDPATTLDHLAVRSAQLYSLPRVAMQVLQLTRNPDVDTRALKECIENDPAIASRILRVVNSSLFGLSREVSDLNQALALLGLKPLKLLVLGFSLPSGLFLDLESKTLLWYWKHTLTKAVAGRELSSLFWRIPGDEAFLAGLFQDLGVLLLFQQLGQPYARFLDRTLSHHLDLGAVERRALGFSHSELSARLLQLWNFPETLCDAIAWQPSPPANWSSLAQILHLSELFAQLFADRRTSALAELLETSRHNCHHLAGQLEPLVLEVERKVDELAEIFSLALPDGLEYRDVLAEAHRQMARVATAAAEDLVRSGIPETGDAEEDWPFDDFDSLTDALTEACAGPIECEPAAKAPLSVGPGGADVGPRQRPAATGRAAVRPTLATSPSALAKTRPVGGTPAPNLLDRLTGVVALCRPARRPLSLLLVKFSAGDELLTACGPQETATMRQTLATVCAQLDHPGTICLPHTDFGFALILPGAERQQAVELGNDLIRTVFTLAKTAGVEKKERLKLDVGVATLAQPPKNFPPRALLDGADRCLYASHASGGGVVKSIEIY
jgi:HD-like signal output (HDOD) protein/GGDEF domain-containing protein